MSKLQPLAGYIVVKREEEASQTSSGIYLTDSAKEKPQRGEVMAVGRGKQTISTNGSGNADVSFVTPQVQVGQKVLFKKYGPTEVEMDGQEMLLLEEDDILAIIQA
ncbi:MAG: co-chaperone GroES [Candidatus Gracilibacteria bacterium]|jgi:chaperonin GroES